jgi:hypothetical protein
VSVTKVLLLLNALQSEAFGTRRRHECSQTLRV